MTDMDVERFCWRHRLSMIWSAVPGGHPELDAACREETTGRVRACRRCSMLNGRAAIPKPPSEPRRPEEVAGWTAFAFVGMWGLVTISGLGWSIWQFIGLTAAISLAGFVVGAIGPERTRGAGALIGLAAPVGFVVCFAVLLLGQMKAS